MDENTTTTDAHRSHFDEVSHQEATLRSRKNDDAHPTSNNTAFPDSSSQEDFNMAENPSSKRPPEVPGYRRTSSLLKSDGPGLNKPSTHNRQVSWGLENNTQLEIDPLQQPNSENNDPTNITLNNGTNISIASLPYYHPARGGSGRITLEELRTTRPMETEAEAYLIQALERRESMQPNKQEDASESAAVLSNIPNEDLDALQTADTGSTCSQRNKGREEGNISSRRPLVRREKATRGGPPQGLHRRQKTVGDQLESLAAAMDVVHMKNLDFLLDIENHSDSMLPPAMQETDNLGNDDWNGAAAALQSNANLLYNRHRTQTENRVDEEMAQTAALLTSQSDSESTQTAASRWRLRQNVSSTKPISSRTAGGGNNSISEVNSEHEIVFESDSYRSTLERNNNPSGQDGEASQEGSDKKPPSFNVRSNKHKFVTELEDFFAPRRKTIFYFLRATIVLIIFPCLGLAAILYYFADNPPTGKVDLDSNVTGIVNENGEIIGSKTASPSWWLLFLGVRQVVIFVLAKAVELFFIDFLSVRSRFSVKVLGPWGTLFILQAKGWPFLVFVWGVLNFALLSGTKPFFYHWGYFQDYVDLFNEKNPSGEVVDSVQFHRITSIAVSLGFIVAAKRFWLGLYLGRQTFSQFSDKLAKVMNKILLVSEVASLGRAFEKQIQHSDNKQRRSTVTAKSFGLNQAELEGLMNALPDELSVGGGGYAHSEPGADGFKRVIDPDDRHPLTGSLTEGQKARITQLLGQWEEPTISDESAPTRVSINELLQFRRALEYLTTAYPFSGSFGLADRRESTVASAQEVYERLLLRSPDPYTLHFDVIALLGVMKSGHLDQEKLKNLIKLFRPDRDGTIEMIDFVKSVDAVYKEIRLLRASVANASKIDRAFETIFNVIFYAVVICVILSQIGYDPLAIFLSISGVVLGFAFMIGSASSKYFEGLLFILVRRPFSIGDGIAISDVNTDCPATGSPFWIVEDVDLFTTKVHYYLSGEKATLNNGSLANSRVINSTQSKNAWLYVLIKFPVSVSFEKLQIFQQALEQYFKNRPREWMSFTQFRATRVEADKGFIEYIIVGQHRLPWVMTAELNQSKADLMHFSMELSKNLNIWYKSPAVPVDLSVIGGINLNEALGNAPPGTQRPNHTSNPSTLPDLTELQNQFRPQFEWQR